MTVTTIGPPTAFADEIHAAKHRQKGESFREYVNRVASALTDNDADFRHFQYVLKTQRFLPGGRIQAAVGSSRVVTPYNCFVSGTIEDSFVDGDGSIMQRATEAAATMQKGGGIGYDFSTLRPRGDKVKRLDSYASGPVSFMDIFDAVCRTTASSGHRRGAQMGVLRVDHPDIEEFIDAKTNVGVLSGFNISVAVTDHFMKCVEAGIRYPLVFEGKVYRWVDARTIWEKIMRSTWDWAEPGVLFIDRINDDNNLKYCEVIAATNPCGEQPLPPFGACLLGSFNMTRYLEMNSEGKWKLDVQAFREDIHIVVKAMDRVVDIATYPLEEHEQEAKLKRRMGLGVTGMANAIEALVGEPCYGSDRYIAAQDFILAVLANEAYRASAILAKERGSFPLFSAEEYAKAPFIQRLEPEVRAAIQEHGLRNSHLTSIAPTGTISLTAGNISSGIEPVFAHSFSRTVRDFNGTRVEKVEDYGVHTLGVEGKTADEVTPQEHVKVLVHAQKWVDSACSKTCNVPATTSWEDFKDIYMQAWKGGAKGCTTFTTGGKRGGILVAEDDTPTAKEAPAAPAIDDEGGPVCNLDDGQCYECG